MTKITDNKNQQPDEQDERAHYLVESYTNIATEASWNTVIKMRFKNQTPKS